MSNQPLVCGSSGLVEEKAEDATYLAIGHYPKVSHEQAKTFALGVIPVG